MLPSKRRFHTQGPLLVILAAGVLIPAAGHATCPNFPSNGELCINPTGETLTPPDVGLPAVSVSGDGTRVTNNGTISNPGSNNIGVSVSNGSNIVLTNTGTIEAGIAVSSSNTSGITLKNTGIINGNIQISAGDNTIEAGGTINGDVFLGSGNDKVTIQPGLNFMGNEVNGGGGTDSFIFGGSGVDSFDVSQANSRLEGFEAFEKSGSSLWVLTGSNTLDPGETLAVKEGTLRVNGSLAGGSWSVAQGAVLQGTGRIGKLLNNGTVGPGASIGTLTIEGDFTQTSDGTLEIEIAADGTSDLLAVTGTATLNGTLSIVPSGSGGFQSGQSYTILTAANGVSGTFATTKVSDTAGLLGDLTAEASYSATQVDVVLQPSDEGSSSPVQRSQEESAETVSRSSAQTVVNAVTARVANVVATIGRLPIRQPTGAPSEPSTDPSGLSGGDGATGLAVWGDSSVTILEDADADTGNSGYLVSALAGVDVLFDDRILLGAALAFDNTDLLLKGSTTGVATATGVQAIVYGGYRFDDTFSVDALAGYGHVFNTARQRPGGVGSVLKSDYESDRWLFSANTRATFPVEERFTVSGMVGYTHAIEIFDVHHRSNGSRVALPSVQTGTFRFGTELSYSPDERLIAYVSGGVERDIYNRAGGSGRTGGFAGAGLTANLTEQLTVGAIFNTNFGREEQTQHQVGANIRYSW